jgi:hypothetical protein
MPSVPLNYLESGEMLAITGPWIDEPAFASVAKLKPLLPDVKEVHAALLAAKPAPATIEPASLPALRADLRSLDARHDHGLRAGVYLLMAAEERALSLDPPDVEAAAEYAAARATLFPTGVAGTSAKYLVEAGNAQKAAAALDADADLGKRLGTIAIDKKTSGHDVVTAYIALGGAVGSLEHQKLVAEGKAAAEAGPRSMRDARNDWMDVVHTVVRILGRVKTDTAAALSRGVVEPAEKAAKRAAAEARAAKKAGEAAPKPDAKTP